jgi:hypothetical protein
MDTLRFNMFLLAPADDGRVDTLILILTIVGLIFLAGDLVEVGRRRSGHENVIVRDRHLIVKFNSYLEFVC